MMKEAATFIMACWKKFHGPMLYQNYTGAIS